MEFLKSHFSSINASGDAPTSSGSTTVIKKREDVPTAANRASRKAAKKQLHQQTRWEARIQLLLDKGKIDKAFADKFMGGYLKQGSVSASDTEAMVNKINSFEDELDEFTLSEEERTGKAIDDYAGVIVTSDPTAPPIVDTVSSFFTKYQTQITYGGAGLLAGFILSRFFKHHKKIIHYGNE